MCVYVYVCVCVFVRVCLRVRKCQNSHFCTYNSKLFHYFQSSVNFISINRNLTKRTDKKLIIIHFIPQYLSLEFKQHNQYLAVRTVKQHKMKLTS